jgi:hypothetical protein
MALIWIFKHGKMLCGDGSCFQKTVREGAHFVSRHWSLGQPSKTKTKPVKSLNLNDAIFHAANSFVVVVFVLLCAKERRGKKERKRWAPRLARYGMNQHQLEIVILICSAWQCMQKCTNRQSSTEYCMKSLRKDPLCGTSNSESH